MFKSLILTVATAASLASAAPAPYYPATSGAQMASITLIDATQHEWTITAPMSGDSFPINVKESISHVHLNNQGNVPCTFYGVDGVEIVSMPGETKDMDVGPPQTIVSGSCAWEGY
jgi:hypothetical protein